MIDNECFNQSLFDELIECDKELIKEYRLKMGAADINLFMRRLIDFYIIENKRAEILEVEEEVDAILVFENNYLSNNSLMTRNNHQFNSIDDYFKNNNQEIIKYLNTSIKNYILNNNIVNIKKAIKIINKNMLELLLQNVPKYFYIIQNKEATLSLYTYRSESNIHKTRLGIVLDFLKHGFDQNFKIFKDLINVNINNSNISNFIKSAGFWLPKNAILHGFNKGAGIIWFDGKLSGDEWILPNGQFIKINSNAIIDFVYSTNSLAKKLHRLNINKKIKDIFSMLDKRIK